MKPLTGIDATFLYMETPETPMHVAGLTLYQPPANLEGSFFEHFKAFFSSESTSPRFSKEAGAPGARTRPSRLGRRRRAGFRLSPQAGHAAGVGDFRQLEELVGQWHSVPLDRSQPLWQFTIVDGLADGNVAIYAKMHHAAVDGGAGMAIAGALYDMGPVPRKVKPPLPGPPVRKPTTGERAILGINDVIQSMARQHIKAMEAVPQILAR